MAGTEKKKKERLDALLVDFGLVESRQKAKALIMAGNVFVNGQREDKPGQAFFTDASLEIRGEEQKYASRGGYKLEKALKLWNIALDGKVCVDVGSSTGGFTDCMLQNGAKKVYAIDAGTNQLAYRLRGDSRVISMEKTNIRYVVPSDFPEKMDFASIDVAFISLTKVFEPVRALLKPDAGAVCLVKPQFEAGREKVGKNGVVREKLVHMEVIRSVAVGAMASGFEISAISYSPIKGPAGNIEYLLYIKKKDGAAGAGGEAADFDEKYEKEAYEAVEAAHRDLA